MVRSGSARYSVVRILLALLVLAFFSGIKDACARERGAITAIDPLGASANVIIDLTGTGFAPVASNNRVLFICDGLSAASTAVTAATLDPATGLRRIGVPVPEGLPACTALVKVINTATGEVINGAAIEVIGITVDDAAVAPGSTVKIHISGTPNAEFVPGWTVTAFGDGIKVDSEKVESPTSIVANITVAPDAHIGRRSIGLMTESQVAVLLGAFTVRHPIRTAVAQSGKNPYKVEMCLDDVFASRRAREANAAGSASNEPAVAKAANIKAAPVAEVKTAQAAKAGNEKTAEVKPEKVLAAAKATPAATDKVVIAKADAAMPAKAAGVKAAQVAGAATAQAAKADSEKTAEKKPEKVLAAEAAPALIHKTAVAKIESPAKAIAKAAPVAEVKTAKAVNADNEKTTEVKPEKVVVDKASAAPLHRTAAAKVEAATPAKSAPVAEVETAKAAKAGNEKTTEVKPKKVVVAKASAAPLHRTAAAKVEAATPAKAAPVAEVETAKAVNADSEKTAQKKSEKVLVAETAPALIHKTAVARVEAATPAKAAGVKAAPVAGVKTAKATKAGNAKTAEIKPEKILVAEAAPAPLHKTAAAKIERHAKAGTIARTVSRPHRLKALMAARDKRAAEGARKAEANTSSKAAGISPGQAEGGPAEVAKLSLASPAKDLVAGPPAAATVKAVKDFPAPKTVASRSAKNTEEGGLLRKLVVALLAPFVLLWYLIAHIWK